MLELAQVAEKYYPLFYEYILKSYQGQQLIFVDGGAHAGVFTDLALFCGGLVYAFEPNMYLYSLLHKKYKNNINVMLSNQAIATSYQKTMFYNTNGIASQAGGIMLYENDLEGKYIQETSGYEVDMIDFCVFIKQLLQKYKKIDCIKLDIEGAEFDVLHALIDQKLYQNIDIIMVETHEVFFENSSEKIGALQQAIKQNNINNIFLDWI